MPLSVRPEPGFKGQFSIAADPGDILTHAQEEFQQRVAYMMWVYAQIADTHTPRDQLRAAARDENLEHLRQLANTVVAGTLAAEEAVQTTFVYQGYYEAALEVIAKPVFSVQEVDENDRPIPAGAQTPAHDLVIKVANKAISTDKIDFKVEVDRTLMVVKVVLRTGEWRWWNAGAYNAKTRRKDQYIRQLAGAARVGLGGDDPSLTTLARRSLGSLQEEFVATEAGSVKNGYLRRLGWRCLVVALLSVGGYMLIQQHCPTDWTKPGSARSCAEYPVAYAFRNFFLVTAGGAVGTWLSFSLRRVILTFLDLAVLEEDQMDPTNRVLFITALSSVVGLLFWVGAVSVGIGDFQSNIAEHGAWALLIGLLLGIAERTMAGAVSKRAVDFAAAIGGR